MAFDFKFRDLGEYMDRADTLVYYSGKKFTANAIAAVGSIWRHENDKEDYITGSDQLSEARRNIKK